MKKLILFVWWGLVGGSVFGQAGAKEAGKVKDGVAQGLGGKAEVVGAGMGQPGVGNDTNVVQLVRAFRFVDSVFGRAAFTYDIAGPEIPKDLQDILTRFNRAVEADKQWFAGYRSRYAGSGQPLPYNERMGVTPEEYQRLQQLEKQPPRLVTIGQKSVTVARDRNVLRFKGDGEAVIFGYLEIDLQQQRVVFAGDTLPYTGMMKAGQLASFQLTEGYSWRLEKVDVKSTLQNNKVTARVVEVDMGTPVEGGRTFLRIKYEDMKEGVSQADLDLIGFVH